MKDIKENELDFDNRLAHRYMMGIKEAVSLVKFTLMCRGGKSFTCRVHEQSLYSSFYENETIHSKAGINSCIIIDVALAKGGPEAIAENFYAAMRYQQQNGGQENDTLVTRSKLNWCLPSLKLCDSVIKEAIKIYQNGDGDQIKRHRRNIFSSVKHKNYKFLKVFDRVQNNEGMSFF